MTLQQPTMTTASGARCFACYPVAVQAVIVDEAGRVLLLSSPHRNLDGSWQVVSGALEAGESVLEGVLRETREEVGAQVRVRPLGAMHVHTFAYDENVPHMIGIYYLLAYEGGAIEPGDDMQGSHFRWWSMDELQDESVILHVSCGQQGVLQRAVDLYGLWKEKGFES